MVIIIIWIALCIVLGVAGSKRKIGGAGAFFISLFLSPLIGLIVVLVSDDAKEIYDIRVVFPDGNDGDYSFYKLRVNTLYIQKNPTTLMYQVNKKVNTTAADFVKEFKSYTDAVDYIKKRLHYPLTS